MVYDATAGAYARRIGTEITATVEAPLDRALLAAFVETVAAVGDGSAGPVADVGCGPGRVAAFLAERGLDVVGFDVSSGMLAAARAAHPDLRFEEGRLTGLPVGDGDLAGAVCWYSVIHTPPDALGEVWAELARALAPRAPLLVAFQAGDGEGVRRADALESGIPLTSYRHAPDMVAQQLADAGFRVTSRATREPEHPHESTTQAFVSADTPGGTTDAHGRC